MTNEFKFDRLEAFLRRKNVWALRDPALNNKWVGIVIRSRGRDSNEGFWLTVDGDESYRPCFKSMADALAYADEKYLAALEQEKAA